MAVRFQDRYDAGRRLAALLPADAGDSRCLVLGLPRGGVPVAFEVARALNAELDVYVVRKVGAPRNEELALGAVASGGVRVFNHDVIAELRLPADLIEAIVVKTERKVAEREATLRGGRPSLDPRDRTVVLVDDGLATGATMRAAVEAVRRQGPRQLIVAAPVAAAATCRAFERDAAVDRFVCVERPDQLQAVGFWYRDFSQTTDAEVKWLLAQSRSCREWPDGDARSLPGDSGLDRPEPAPPGRPTASEP